MEEVIVKLYLLTLLAIPFVAPLSDVLGRTDGLMSRAVIGVTITLILGESEEVNKPWMAKPISPFVFDAST